MHYNPVLDARPLRVFPCLHHERRVDIQRVNSPVRTDPVAHLDGGMSRPAPEICNNVPLRDGDDALEVNWCALTTRDADGKIVYKNAFATNHEINEENVAEIVRNGRARWKVENENNNILKTKGYHLTHNFGHGKENLSAVLATLNLFAFLVHTVLEKTDANYQCVRKKLGTRVNFFNDIRALTRYLCFDSWGSLLLFMIRQLEIDAPDTS